MVGAVGCYVLLAVILTGPAPEGSAFAELAQLGISY
jgi:hypothetical protein